MCIRDRCKADSWSSKAILDYIRAQKEFLEFIGIKVFHSPENLLIEQYIDNRGRINYIFHTVFGRRVNNVLSRALANILKRRAGISVKIMVDDNGFIISIPQRREVGIKEILEELRKRNIRKEIEEAVLNSQYVWRSFRHCATRALMILRRYLGHEVRVSKQQMNAETLFRVCLRIPGFPLIKEAVREIVEDKMDVKNAEKILNDIRNGRRRWVILPKYDLPSPFAHGLITRGMADVVLMEDRVKLLHELHEMVMRRIKGAS